MPAERQGYDYRLRELVVRTKNLKLAERYGVPVATARSWIRRGVRPVVTCAEFEENAELTVVKVARLERRVEVLIALVRLLMVLVRLSGAKLNGKRVPEGEDKLAVSRAVQKAVLAIPLRLALRVIGLTSARYHAWQRGGAVCELGDQSSCPKTLPGQLTAEEVRETRDMVTSGDFRHMSTRALALHAQRIGRVMASPGTWWRRTRLHGWVRPRLRVHPPKPKLGIRASRSNEFWHIDVPLIRLLDGTQVYIHGVIDNFSRRLLAWEVATKLDPTATCRVLLAAGKHLTGSVPTVVADSGGENVNGEVDDLIEGGTVKRVLAQVEVAYSNSVIEAWWRSLKHSWLFLHSLDSIAAVERLVAFYVEQYNTVMPNAAFDGHTPDEVYFGQRPELEEERREARQRARAERMLANRALACEDCLGRGAPSELISREAA